MTRNSLDNTRALKRLAIQIAAQLPEDVADAREVLALCNRIVDRFLAVDRPAPLFKVISLATEPIEREGA